MPPAEHSSIPADYLDMFEKPLIPCLTTMLEDGTPRCAPLWCDYDGEYVRFTNESTHVVSLTVAKNPHVVVCMGDPAKSMRYLEVRGVVEKIEPDPRAVHLYRLAAKRGGITPDPLPTDTKRVILYVKPTWVTCFPGV